MAQCKTLKSRNSLGHNLNHKSIYLSPTTNREAVKKKNFTNQYLTMYLCLTLLAFVAEPQIKMVLEKQVVARFFEWLQSHKTAKLFIYIFLFLIFILAFHYYYEKNLSTAKKRKYFRASNMVTGGQKARVKHTTYRKHTLLYIPQFKNIACNLY